MTWYLLLHLEHSACVPFLLRSNCLDLGSGDLDVVGGTDHGEELHEVVQGYVEALKILEDFSLMADQP